MQLPLPAYDVPRGVIEIKSQPETRSLFGEACRGRVGVRDDAEVENHRRATLESAKKNNTSRRRGVRADVPPQQRWTEALSRIKWLIKMEVSVQINNRLRPIQNRYVLTAVHPDWGQETAALSLQMGRY